MSIAKALVSGYVEHDVDLGKLNEDEEERFWIEVDHLGFQVVKKENGSRFTIAKRTDYSDPKHPKGVVTPV